MEIVEERLRGLLLQGLDADAAAYQRFLKELSAHLRAFLRRRLAQRPDEVEDLVQETLVEAWRSRRAFTAAAAFCSLLALGASMPVAAQRTAELLAQAAPAAPSQAPRAIRRAPRSAASASMPRWRPKLTSENSTSPNSSAIAPR